VKEILGNIALWPAEQLINGAIASDPHVQKKIAAFAGKAIQINTRMPALEIRVVMEADHIRLTAVDSAQYALPVDASINGPTGKLLQQLFDTSTKHALVDEDVELDGDVQLIQDLLTTIKTLDIDWQDYLAPVLGDVLTQQIGQSLDETRAWASDSRKRVQRSMEDYLKEEARLFPHEQQLRNFADNLDELKLRIDRVDARVQLLRQRLKTLHTPYTRPATDTMH